MALDPILWALHDSPVKDTTERTILIVMAEKADADGCNAYPSKKTAALTSLCDEKTVQRKLADLRKRKVIALGDQQAAYRIPKRYRPTVYDLLVPYTWYGTKIDRVNADRASRGLEPLTPENRPDIDPAPVKAGRSDKGVPRPKKAAKKAAASPKKQGGQTVPPQDSAGGTESPVSGGTVSPDEGGLTVPQTVPSDPPPSDPSRPAVPSVRSVEAVEAGTDGRNGSGAVDLKTSPGAALLMGLGATRPVYLLKGEPLEENAGRVDELLTRGWVPSVIRGVLGYNLPGEKELKRSAAAVLAYRLRKLLEAPVPREDEVDVPNPREPLETRYAATWAAHDRTVEEALNERRWSECDGDEGTCGRPTVDDVKCAEHAGWALCPADCGRRVPDSMVACRVCHEQQVVGYELVKAGEPPF